MERSCPLLISERKHVDVLKITNFIIITTCSCLFTNPHVQRCATHTPFGALSARIQVHVLVEVFLGNLVPCCSVVDVVLLLEDVVMLLVEVIQALDVLVLVQLVDVEVDDVELDELTHDDVEVEDVNPNP